MKIDWKTCNIWIDNHVLETFRTCEEKFNLQIYQQQVPIEKAPALAFGIAMHAGRECYKRLLIDAPNVTMDHRIDAAVIVAAGAWNREMPASMKDEVMGNDKRSQNNLIRLLRGYLSKFGGMEYKPILVEQPVTWPLLVTVSGWQVNYTALIDEVVEYENAPWILEFKTHANVFGPPGDSYFMQWRQADSITGYVWAAGMFLNKRVRGAIVHAAWVQAEPKGKSKYSLPDYFQMDCTERSDARIEEWKENVAITVDRLITVIESGKYQRQNNATCVNYGKCTYYDVCNAEPAIRSMILTTDFEKREWDPLARVKKDEVNNEST